MNSIDVLEPLFAPINAIQRLIEAFDDQGIIIGGVAASILGRPRLTADADAMILLSAEDIPQLVERAAKEGLVPWLPAAILSMTRPDRFLTKFFDEHGFRTKICR